MKSVIWSVLLLGVYLLIDVSGQTVTFTSSLESTNRTYFCPGEIVTYVCSGVGNEMNLYAPPFVSINAPLSYVRGADTPGSGRLGRGPIVVVLISTTVPLMEADLIVQNSSLPEFSVHCIVRSTPLQPEAVAQHRPTGPPLDVNSLKITPLEPSDFDLGSVEVTWRHTVGNYDVSHYTVQLFEDNVETASSPIVIFAESNSLVSVFSAIFPVSFNRNIRASITVTSKCDQTSDGVSIGINGITQSSSIIAASVFLGLLSIATVILTVVVIVLGVCLCTKNCCN